jgi:hypothetical protein
MAMEVVFGFIHRENKDEARNHAEPAESGLAFVPGSTEFVSYLVATIPRAENGRSVRPGLRCGVRHHRFGEEASAGGTQPSVKLEERGRLTGGKVSSGLAGAN